MCKMRAEVFDCILKAVHEVVLQSPSTLKPNFKYKVVNNNILLYFFTASQAGFENISFKPCSRGLTSFFFFLPCFGA